MQGAFVAPCAQKRHRLCRGTGATRLRRNGGGGRPSYRIDHGTTPGP